MKNFQTNSASLAAAAQLWLCLCLLWADLAGVADALLWSDLLLGQGVV
jgi:hypothetical protein